jgi:hypothetical protein
MAPGEVAARRRRDAGGAGVGLVGRCLRFGARFAVVLRDFAMAEADATAFGRAARRSSYFLSGPYMPSRHSTISPATAEAATVSGEAR